MWELKFDPEIINFKLIKSVNLGQYIFRQIFELLWTHLVAYDCLGTSSKLYCKILRTKQNNSVEALQYSPTAFSIKKIVAK